MSAKSSPGGSRSVAAAAPLPARATGASRRAFLALCERDLYVTFRRDLIPFLSQSLLQPIFFLFVFGRVLPQIGAARGGYGTQLMPGVMGLTLVLTALSALFVLVACMPKYADASDMIRGYAISSLATQRPNR